MIPEVLILASEQTNGAMIFDIDHIMMTDREITTVIDAYNKYLEAHPSANGDVFGTINTGATDTGPFANDAGEAQYKIGNFPIFTSDSGFYSMQINPEVLKCWWHIQIPAFLTFMCAYKQLGIKVLYNTVNTQSMLPDHKTSIDGASSIVLNKGVAVPSSPIIASDGIGINQKIGDFIKTEPGLSARMQTQGIESLAIYLMEQVDSDTMDADTFKVLAAQAAIVLQVYSKTPPADFTRICKFLGI